MLTQSRLGELFSYDPETGHFTRLPGRAYRKKGGDIAGCKKSGYLVIRVDGILYRAHRLAWLAFTGKWPDGEIDHINGVKDDNRIANLRDVPIEVNRQNQVGPRRSNKTGYLGVYFYKTRNQYKAEITVNRKNKCLGYYATAELAYQAYLEAKRTLHQGNTL